VKSQHLPDPSPPTTNLLFLLPLEKEGEKGGGREDGGRGKVFVGCQITISPGPLFTFFLLSKGRGGKEGEEKGGGKSRGAMCSYLNGRRNQLLSSSFLSVQKEGREKEEE